MERADTAPAPPVAPPAAGTPVARAAAVVVGLTDDDAHRPAEAYFAAFRWEPPPIDPISLSASAFLTMLDDVATTKT